MKQTLLITNILNDPAALQAVGEAIRDGKTVVFPTETVYGLGANGLSEDAIDGIYEAKGRPSDNPLILHISRIEMLEALVASVSEDAQALIDAFWPGPLTLVFNKSEKVPYRATGGLETVAIRMPRHPIARAIIDAAGVPVAAPSANLSGKPSPTKAAHVIEDLSGRVDFIVCEDSVEIGLESTVCDVTQAEPVVLRPGSIGVAEIRQVTGKGHLDPGIHEVKHLVKPKSPGMKYRHYAPEAPMILIEGSMEEVVEYIRGLHLETERVGYLLFEDTLKTLEINGQTLGPREDPDIIALRLFENLRHFKAAEYDKIVCEIPARGTGVSDAIRNRLLKAAGNDLVILSKS